MSGARRIPAPETPRSGFRRVLVANRGEIAVRIIRTLRELDITSIALFSEPDREALHVLLADEAYPIGPGPSRESYLDLERVVATARRVKADAVHPGYGSRRRERAASPRAFRRGRDRVHRPPPSVIEALGDKLAAREVARARACRWCRLGGRTRRASEEARVAAAEIGYPLLLKAAAGGGGKGMRVVRGAEDLSAAWDMTRGEARSAFGDDRVYAEKYIERPRHVEAQILADAEGRVVFLGERECSISAATRSCSRRRRARASTRKRVGRSGRRACTIARAVGYRNAGTVSSSSTRTVSYFLEVKRGSRSSIPSTER